MKQFLYSSTGNNLLKGMIPSLLFFLLISLSNGLKAQVYSANFNSNIQSWVNGSSNSWSRVSTGGVSNSGCLTSTVVCEQGQQFGSCINQNNYFIATPSISLTAGNTYQISIKCSVATESTRKLVLGVNTSQARSGAMTLQNFGYVSTGGYTAFTVNYTPTSSGSPYFVLWGEKFTTQTVGLWLDDFSVTLVNSAPAVNLTNPDNNSVYVEGASPFLFKASVSDAENNLSKVEFYSNGAKVGERTSLPLSINYIPTVGGTYSLTAKATDSYGAITISAARSISFRTLPVVEYVTPDLEFSSYAEGPFNLVVNASDADGTVGSVKFYIDDNLVYTDAASPWAYNWSATPGGHTFKAVATDNNGLESAANVDPAWFDVITNTCALSTPTSSSTTICEGASAIFTSGYSSLLTGTIQWQRQPSGGSWANISGATSASYSATLAGNYRGVWTFENGATCTTASKTLVVAPNPTVTVDPVTVYGNEPALVVAVASGGTAPYTYSWSTGNCEGISPCDSVMISNFTNALTVSVVDGNGCGVIDTVSVTHCHTISLANSGPNYSDISPGSELFTQYQAICAGNSVRLHAQTSVGFEGSLSWFKNGNLIDGYLSDSLSESPDSNIIYKVFIPSTSTCDSRFAQIRVQVINTQTNFTFDSLHCHAHLVDSLAPTFSASLLSPGAAQETTQFSQGSTISYSPTYTTPGRYNLTYIVTDGNYGCSTTNYLHGNWSDFKVQVPPVYVNHALTSYGIAVGSLGQPFASPDKYKYEWFKNGVHYADGQQMSAPDTLGPYYAIGTDSLGCNASDTLTYVYRDMYSTRNIWVTDLCYDSLTINWDTLTALNHLVVVREGRPIEWAPSQGKGYQTSNLFGESEIKDGHFGLYSGPFSKIQVSGLNPKKTYYAACYAWKIVDGDTLWDTTHVQERFTTKEISSPKFLESKLVASHFVKLAWKKRSGMGVIIVGKTGTSILSGPADSTIYSDSSSFVSAQDNLEDGSRILYQGSLLDSITIGDLDSNKCYEFKIWNYYIKDQFPIYSRYGKGIFVKTDNSLPDSLIVIDDTSSTNSWIRVSGKNLFGVSGVLVGNKTAKFNIINDKALKIKIPQGEGIVEVRVIKNNMPFFAANNFVYSAISPEAERNLDCGSDNLTQSIESAVLNSTTPINQPYMPNGYQFTPSGDLTILVLCKNFFDYDIAGETAWPNGSGLPSNFEDIFYANNEEFDEYADDFTLSNFYYQMSKRSLKPFKVRFKIFPVPIPTSVLPSNSSISSFIQQQINNGVVNPDFWDDLDTRQNNPNFMFNNSTSHKDNIVDYCMYMERRIDPTNSGVGGFVNPAKLDGAFGAIPINLSFSIHPTNVPNPIPGTLKIDGSSAAVISSLNWRTWPMLVNTIVHEISHSMFYSAHVFFNNSEIGSFFNSGAGWGTMNWGANGGINATANPWESYINNWNPPTLVSKSTSVQEFNITDFAHHPDVVHIGPYVNSLRIEIPNTFNMSQSLILPQFQYLWLSYHSGLSNFDRGDDIHDQYSNRFTPDRGLYAMVDNAQTPDLMRFNPRVSNGFMALHKDGFCEFQATSFPLRPFEIFFNNRGRECPDLILRNTGSVSLNNRFTLPKLFSPFNFSQGSIRSAELIFPLFVNRSPDMKWRTSNAFGNSTQSEELSLNSDNTIFGHLFYNRTSVENSSAKVFNGLAVKVFKREDGKDMKVTVRYDDNTLVIDKNLIGYFCLYPIATLHELQKPDLVIASGKKLSLIKSSQPNREKKYAVVGSNLYQDFITPSRLVCKSGSILKLEANSQLIIDNESGLLIESNASVILGENASIVIKSGCTIVIQPGASISADVGAKIVVADRAYYCFDNSLELNPNALFVGSRLGAVSPKLVPYFGSQSNCSTLFDNFTLSFQCNSGEQAILVNGYSQSVDLYLGNTVHSSNISSPIYLTGLDDGYYTVKPHTPVSGALGGFSTGFHLLSQNGISLPSGSISNILVLNRDVSLTSGNLIFEPNCQVFIKGTPVTPSNCLGGNCAPSVSGGDITLSGTARVDVRDGVKFQGMCNSMWGGISISDHAGLTAYNNMIFSDSYDGISTLANEDNSDLFQLHVFNAIFENNYRAIKQTDAIESFNFVRNCTFTSDENQMKQPFDRPDATSCVKYISNTHLEYEHCMVNQGNFWNNTILKAQTGLKISNNSRGFYSVLNTFSNIYGKSIHLHNGSGVSTNFDRNVVSLPSDFLFCSQNQEGPSDYIVYQTPYAKYGFYIEGSGNLPVITSTTISGPGFGTTGGIFRNVGIYSHGASSLSLSQSTLQNLNYGLVFYGSQTSGTAMNNVKENNFINNEQNLRFKSSYQTNHKLTLKCNRFTTPTSPAPFSMRCGIYVEAGAGMPDIGGNLSFSNPNTPSGNWWPSVGTSNSTVSPWEAPNGAGLNTTNTNVVHWLAPSGWESVHNLTENTWSYFRYTNEFLGPFYNPNNIPYFDPTIVQRLILSRVNIPIPNTNPVQYYPNQQIPSGWSSSDYDEACSFFAGNLVFPTRQAVDSNSQHLISSVQSAHRAYLEQNIPNPAANSTTIGFRLPEDARRAKMELFELTTGRILKSVGIPATGKGQVEINLSQLAAGIYGYRLIAEGSVLDTKKLIVIKQ